MDEYDRWILLDGPEPEPVRVLLGMFRRPPAGPPPDTARMQRRLLARLDAKLGLASAEQEPAPAPHTHLLKVAPPAPEDIPPPPKIDPPSPPPAPAPRVVPAPAALAGTLPSAATDTPSDDLRLGGLTLKQLASFRAELALVPHEEPRIRHAYGVESPEATATLERLWHEHMARYPSALGQFVQFFTSYTEYYRTHVLSRAQNGRQE